MKIEKWECDKCKKVFDDEEKVQVITIKFGGRNYYGKVSKEMHVCDVCLSKLGLEKEKNLNADGLKTVQDRLFDAVCELIDDAVDNR